MISYAIKSNLHCVKGRAPDMDKFIDYMIDKGTDTFSITLSDVKAVTGISVKRLTEIITYLAQKRRLVYEKDDAEKRTSTYKIYLDVDKEYEEADRVIKTYDKVPYLLKDKGKWLKHRVEYKAAKEE